MLETEAHFPGTGLLAAKSQIIVISAMKEQEQLEARLKAEAFDRLLEKYRSLEDDAGFYSKNWVELTELIEAEVKRIRWILRKE